MAGKRRKQAKQGWEWEEGPCWFLPLIKKNIVSIRFWRMFLPPRKSWEISLNFTFVLQILTFPGVKIFQCCNSITFVNVYDLKHKLLEEVRLPSPLFSTGSPRLPQGPSLLPLAIYPSTPKPPSAFQVEMVAVPLKEEEVYRLFPSSEGRQDGRMCQCYCDCDELEPPPRVSNLFFSAFPSALYKEVQQQVVVVLRKENPLRDFDS